jgi:hypothetical protein
MKNTSSIYNIAIALILLLAACAGQLQRRETVSDKRMDGENQFDPLDFIGDDTIVTGKNLERALKPDTVNNDSLALKAMETHADSTAPQDQVIFRVQIYTTKSVDDAHQYSESVKQLFPEGVNVEYQIPYYKVQVGEFDDVSQGQAFLEKVKQLGFENAWLVRIIR